MKAIVTIILAVIITLIMAGCASVLKGLEPSPKLGVYSYTHKEKFNGSPVREIPIWVDKNFGEADKVAIDDAVNMWNFALNGYVVLKVVDTQFDMEVPKITEQVSKGGWLFMKIESTNKMVPDSKTKGFWTLGFVERIGGNHMYLIRDRLSNEAVFGVTLHEIGHLMGSPHVGQRLMYPHYSRARFQCVDYATIVKVAEYFNLPLAGLNYCTDDQPVESHEAGADNGCPVTEGEEMKIFQRRVWESF